MTLENVYLMAVKHHDVETAQALINSAARKAGFAIGPVYHGCNSEEGFTVFDPSKGESGQNTQMRGFFFSGDRNVAESYSQGSENVRAFYLRMEKPLRISEAGSGMSLYEIQQEAEKHLRGLDSVFDGQAEDADGLVVDGASGGLGMKLHTEYVVFSPTQIKSADPEVRGDDGQVVPLDKRFADTPDIRGETADCKPALSGKSGGLGSAAKHARRQR